MQNLVNMANLDINYLIPVKEYYSVRSFKKQWTGSIEKCSDINSFKTLGGEEKIWEKYNAKPNITKMIVLNL